MLDFNYYAPTYIEFGKNKEKKVVELIKKFEGKRVLIHYGGGSVVKSGLLDRVKNLFDNENVFYVELGGVVPNPESDLVYKGIELCKENDLDFILAIGGGSVIDSSKAIAAGVIHDGDFWDFFKDDNREVITKTLPVGVILTIAAAGSETSNSIVITHSETHKKRGNIKSDAVRPVFAIMNPELTMTLPKYQIACGVVDIMVHTMERYFSNTEGCIVTDNMCEALLKSMLVVGKKAIDNPLDYESRSNIMWAGSISHNNILGVDREQDWASHKIEHELSAKYGIAHGAGLAVIVIKWMKYVSKINPDKFKQFAKNIFNCDDIDEAIFALQNYWVSLGMPKDLKELGYSESDLENLVNNVDYANGFVGNYVKLDKNAVKEIYKL